MGIHDRSCLKLASPDVDFPHAGCSALWITTPMAPSNESLIPSCKHAAALFCSLPDDESSLGRAPLLPPCLPCTLCTWSLLPGWPSARMFSPPSSGCSPWVRIAYYVERPRLQRYLIVLVFFVLGLMAKPMLVTLPFVLLLLDYWPLQRFQQKSQIRKAGQTVNKPLIAG